MHQALSIVPLLLVVSCIFACKENSTSETKADLSRPDTVGVVKCIDSQLGASRPVTKRYLRNLLNKIAAANRDTFRGDLVPENFCIGSQINELNAYALSYDRSINFGRELLLKANLDSEIMAVLTHEIAHVILRHDMGGTQNVADQTAVSGRESYILSQRVKLASEVSLYRTVLTSEAGAVAELLNCSLKRDNNIAIILDSLSTKKSEAKQIATGANNLLWSPSTLINKNKYLDERITTYTDVFINQHRIYNNARPSIDGELSGEPSENEFQSLLAKIEATGCRNPQMKAKRASSAQIEESINKLNKKIEDVGAQVRVLNTHGMGEQESANWKESEADDTGFQLYNNTGLSAYGFTWIYALTGAKKAGIETEKLDDGDIVKKMATYCVNKGEAERGLRSHPVACWRILNVLSEQRNKALQNRNLGSLPIETVFSKSPSLQDVHQELRRER